MDKTNYPRSIQDARDRRYDVAHDNPRGNPYRDGDCAFERWGEARRYQCGNPNGHGPGALYCEQHAEIVRLWEACDR